MQWAACLSVKQESQVAMGSCAKTPDHLTQDLTETSLQHCHFLQGHEKKVLPRSSEDLDKTNFQGKLDEKDAEALPVTPQKMERTSTPEQISPQGIERHPLWKMLAHAA